jgi:hypothetical protein
MRHAGMKLALVALLLVAIAVATIRHRWAGQALVAVMLGVALVVTARRGAEKNDREHLVGG